MTPDGAKDTQKNRLGTVNNDKQLWPGQPQAEAVRVRSSACD